MSDTPRTPRDALKAQGELVRKSYEDKIARLERELAALRADAERYRWLRDERHEYELTIEPVLSETKLDAAIDAAMKKGGK